MFRTDNSTSVPSLPTIPAVGTPGFFTNGNPVSAIPATIVDDWWTNQIQEEIMTVIVNSGLTPTKTDFTQLWQALQRLYPRQAARTDFTVYVDPVNGDDSHDGMTAGTAYRTIQYATNQMLFRTDLNGHTVTIKLMPGTHQGVVHLGTPTGCLGYSNFVYDGDRNNPSNVIISGSPPPGSGCMVFAAAAQATVIGVKLQMLSGADSGCAGIYVTGASNVMPYFCDFGAMGVGSHIIADGGTAACWGPYTISGGAAAHWNCSRGTINNAGRPNGGPTGAPYLITILNNPNFTGSFVVSTLGGNVLFSSGLTGFSGGAQGRRFYVDTSARVNIVGRGASFFPGTVAGIVDSATYGVYV